METTVKNVQNGKGEETAACETMELVMESRSENEEFARVVAAVFASRLDPTLEELDDIKTAVSEAVTNAVIHGYRGGKGKITLAATAWEKETVFRDSPGRGRRDRGCGAGDGADVHDMPGGRSVRHGIFLHGGVYGPGGGRLRAGKGNLRHDEKEDRQVTGWRTLRNF